MTTIDVTIHPEHAGAPARPRARAFTRRVVTALVLTSGLATAAQATDLGLDASRYFVQHQVKGALAPVYQVLPSKPGPNPFNDMETPYLLPCWVQNFGGQVKVDSAPGGDVSYPRLTVRFYRKNGQPIVTQGFDGIVSLDHLDSDLPPLAPGESEDVGYTPLSTVNPFRTWMFQPKDLPANQPVRMELSVTPFADAQYTQPGPDSNPGNDTVNFWVQRAC
jgi:hypothetical protein